MIETFSLTKKYNGDEALKGVSLRIDRTEFIFMVGPSGAGKSTFLKLIIREIRPSSGIIKVFGRSIANFNRKQVSMLRRNIGMIFQDYRLLDEKTVYENIAFTMRVVGARNKEIAKQVPWVLEKVGLKDKSSARITDLSGGEQQRVGIARAIVNHPLMIIADEPTGNLDPKNSMEIINLLKSINEQGTTVLVATHDSEIVDRLRKRVIYLEGGRIVGDEARGAYLRVL